MAPKQSWLVKTSVGFSRGFHDSLVRKRSPGQHSRPQQSHADIGMTGPRPISSLLYLAESLKFVAIPPNKSFIFGEIFNLLHTFRQIKYL